jgi:outer membrane murein-binding lipoprotein Lpp
MANPVQTVLGAAVIASMTVAGCSKKADKIAPAYVSPVQYAHYECDQIRAELVRVSTEVRKVSGAQNKNAKNDAVATGVGIVLFWPALFFLMGDDEKEELARYKGEYEALQKAAAEKDCDVAAEIAEAQQLDQERKTEKDEPTEWEQRYGS